MIFPLLQVLSLVDFIPLQNNRPLSVGHTVIATSQNGDIVTLDKASKVDVNIDDVNIDEKEILKSVGVQVVDDTSTVWIDLGGIIDYKVEIQRLNKTLKSAKVSLEQLERKMKADGYKEKAPEALSCRD